MSTLLSGDKVWFPDDVQVWEMGVVVTNDVTADRVTIEYSIPKKVVTLDRVQVHRLDETHLNDLNDLCHMNSLHEAPLLHIIKRRLLQDSIYTNAGDILISLNPYKHIPKIYDNPLRYYTPKQHRQSVHVTANKNVLPHVYYIANDALVHLSSNNDREAESFGGNQSIIISGESGAGKTEASKYVMNFLISVNEKRVDGDISSTDSSGGVLPSSASAAVATDVEADSIKNILLQSSCIFESFGNAKTVRNDNSSRFGKYIRLQYSAQDTILSAITETFLLEKSRLTCVANDERNYHIFYQLIRGLPSYNAGLCDKLQLRSIDSFGILTQGKCTIIKTEQNDIDDFNLLLNALRTLGFVDKDIDDIITLLGTILHLGNVTCTSNPLGENSQAILASPSLPLADISSNFGVQEESFYRSITTHSIKIGGGRASLSTKVLTHNEAQNNILALIKWIYNKLFIWIVQRTNESFIKLDKNHYKRRDDPSKFIGILDIFGFEILQSNSLEQLCINYTNERLQQQFNDHVFILEQQQYIIEGINVTSFTYRDNQQVIDLIGKKPQGLLCVLEEHGAVIVGNRKPDDVKLVKAFNQFHDDVHPSYIKSRFTDGFTIIHYAGRVSYTIDGFLTKNNDSLQDDILELMKCTTNAFLLDVAFTSAQRRQSIHDSKKMASAITVSYQFRNQLDTLISTLKTTTPHYIKCIKPNSKKQPSQFDSCIVMEQLRYSGALEVVRIRREGYPHRMSYIEFILKNDKIASMHGYNRNASSSCTQENCRDIASKIAAASMDPCMYQLGLRLIFMKPEGVEAMDSMLYKIFRCSAITLQSLIRRHIQFKRYRRCIHSVIAIQCAYRCHTAVRKYRRMVTSSKLLQRNWRVIVNFRKFRSKMQYFIANYRAFMCTLIQKTYRRHVSNNRFLLLKATVYQAQAVISSNIRVHIARKRYQQTLRRVVMMQSHMRKKLCMLHMHIEVRSIIRIQRAMRRKIARMKMIKVHWSIVLLQSHCRKYIAYRYFMPRLQSSRDAILARKKAIEKAIYDRNLGCIVSIQSLYRGWTARVYVSYAMVSVVRLQIFYRYIRLRNRVNGAVNRKHQCMQKARDAAAIRIQSVIRGKLCSNEYYRERTDVILVQCMIRRYMAIKTVKGMLHVQEQLRLQREYEQEQLRLQKEQQEYEEEQRRLQREYEQEQLRLQREQELEQQRLIEVEQYNQRLAYEQEQLLLLMDYAATRVQATIRGKLHRNRRDREYIAAVTIQNLCRMITARCRYTEAVISAIVIQSRARVVLARMAFNKHMDAVITIQKYIRQAMCTMRYIRMLYSSIVIQRYTRGMLVRHSIVAYNAALNDRAVAIQRHVRGMLGRVRRSDLLLASMILYDSICRYNRYRILRDSIRKMHSACYAGDGDSIAAMLQHQPDLRYLRDSSYSNRTIYQSIFSNTGTHSDVVLSLLGQLNVTAAESIAVDGNGDTLLHYLAKRPSVSVMEMLIRSLESIPATVSDDVWIDDDDTDAATAAASHTHLDDIRVSVAYYNHKANAPNKSSTGSSNTIGTSSNSTSLKSGWLRKRRDNGNWKVRYAVLSDTHISYYDNDDCLHRKGTVPLSGCSITRVSGSSDMVIEVISPLMIEKKTLFGKLKKKSMYFLFDTENELQKWLIPLKAVADGVGEFRNNHIPIAYVNRELRKEFVNVTNKRKENPLHTLVGTNGCRSSAGSIDAIAMIVLLLESGLDINQRDVDGNTPLHVAIAANNIDVATLLIHRNADCTVANSTGHTVFDVIAGTSYEHLSLVVHNMRTKVSRHLAHLPLPPLLKDYCFLSIGFLNHSMSQLCDNPLLTVNVYNSKNNHIESGQDLLFPAAVLSNSNSVYWGMSFCMQMPLQNIDTGAYIVVQARSIREQTLAVIGTLWALIQINKDTIDTCRRVIRCYKGEFNTACVGINGSVTSASAIAHGCDLEIDIQLHRHMRNRMSLDLVKRL